MAWRLRGLLLASLAAVAGPAAAIGHVFPTRPADATEAAAAQVVGASVLARLPPVWRGALAPDLAIEWRDDLPADVHGRRLGTRVLLRRGLLAIPSTDHAPHPAALALAHELAHALDRGPQGGLSSEPRLLDLAGWQRTPLRGRAARGSFTDRSPDPYELENPREFVAVNLERFLFDPEYACRRPALHRHFAVRLQAALPAAACAPGQPFVQAQPGADGPALLELDPARVAGVDYLLAEPAGAVMSRWGHGMLRLVVCAPHRAPGPDCRLDLDHHLVLSFRAFVDDVQVSGWRGLTGAYPSRLFVLPLARVVDEYTKVELRGLRSVPLSMSRGDIDALVERAAQLHWSHDGRYYFVTSNCAVETWRLLREGAELAGTARASLTPTGLLRRLQRAGTADASVLQDRARAIREGYYFESERPRYDVVFDAARARLALPARDVDGWLDLDPAIRGNWIGQADLQAAAALLVLEAAAERREEKHARTELRDRLLSRAGDDDPARAQALETLRLAERLTRPARLLPGDGYGIPQGAERAALADAASDAARAWRAAGERLEATALEWLSPRRRERVAATRRNLGLLGERLRELHRASGGLDLAVDAR